LFLDNAAGPEQLQNLLPPPGCALLVTSRRRFTLPGLSGPHYLDVLPMAKAVKFLRGLAARLTRAEAEGIAGLCGRLPQALRLAGSLLTERADLSVARYRERLREARFAKQGGLDEVAATVASSEESLPQPLRTRWRELAVLAGAFELAWATAVWGVDEDTAEEYVAALGKISLLKWDAEAQFYRLHDLVREYAVTHLDVGACDAAARRHTEYFCQAARETNDAFQRGGETITMALRRFDRLWTDVQAGFAWATKRRQGDADVARVCRDYAIRCGYVLNLRQHPREQIVWLEFAAESAREIGDRRGEGVALGNLGNAYAALGQVDQAIGYYEQGLAIDREIGDRRGEGADLGNLGNAYYSLGQVDQTIGYHEQALAVAREIGDRRGEGADLGNLGGNYYRLGQVDKAIGYHEQHLAIAREIGDRRSEGCALGNLGLAYAALGQVDQAIGYHEQHLAIARETGDRQGEGNALGSLGQACAAFGPGGPGHRL
jgi:tetratricopeptide (TPR) repeat protein